MDVITSNLHSIGVGLGITALLTVIGFGGAMVIGSFVAMCRVSPIPPLRAAGTLYVEFFRNIPLLSLLILFAFGLPDLGLTISLFWCAALGLMLAAGAFVCESIRAGVNAIPLGQAEAARAIGLTFTQSLRLVILPQALRTMIAPLVNSFIGVALGSSLASAVGVSDLTNRTEFIMLQNAEPAIFIAAGVLYMVISFGGSGVGATLERKLRIGR
ncbi:amino acid ABC transporter permease [Dermatophilaceae bacterium Sec6.4]|nr:amino acid ABC transporter permease [Actinomycetota bacterium]